MFILLGYGLCLELALVVATLLFALSAACLLMDEGSLQLGSFVRIVVRGPGHTATESNLTRRSQDEHTNL